MLSKQGKRLSPPPITDGGKYERFTLYIQDHAFNRVFSSLEYYIVCVATVADCYSMRCKQQILNL